jgi:hypothetical protein
MRGNICVKVTIIVDSNTRVEQYYPKWIVPITEGNRFKDVLTYEYDNPELFSSLIYSQVTIKSKWIEVNKFRFKKLTVEQILDTIELLDTAFKPCKYVTDLIWRLDSLDGYYYLNEHRALIAEHHCESIKAHSLEGLTEFFDDVNKLQDDTISMPPNVYYRLVEEYGLGCSSMSGNEIQVVTLTMPGIKTRTYTYYERDIPVYPRISKKHANEIVSYITTNILDL